LNTTDLTNVKIFELAHIVRDDWEKVSGHARPYLSAMCYIGDINERYCAEDAASVVGYFLSNASGWKGETAKAVKKELRRRVKVFYKF
jgi:hypothetical protein